MPSGQPAIEFRNVSLSFDDKHALDDISLQLQRGEMICITGVSGSGKSVLLRVASGLMTPDAGEVFVEGRSLGGLDEQELLELRSTTMGFLFQEQSLFTGMSVYDNTAYRLDEHGWSAADTEYAVREILRFVGLEEDIDKLPEELSVGMGRRIEFARALVGWPRIMLFDEATAGLDPINARNMLDLVIRARDIHQISSLFVTKQLHEIPYVANYSAVQHEGGEISIQKVDPSRDAIDRTRVLVLENGRSAFFGTPAEFESTVLPAVTHLTHPESSAPRRIATSPTPGARASIPTRIEPGNGDRGWRMEDRGKTENPPSSILHLSTPLSSILYPLYPLSSILYPPSSILSPLSSILHPPSSILYPPSSILPSSRPRPPLLVP